MLFRFLNSCLLCASVLWFAPSFGGETPLSPASSDPVTGIFILHPSSFILGIGSFIPPESSYNVPYRLSETSHILVRAKINGHGPFTFIMDSGAPAIFLAKPIAKRCGVKANGEGWGVLGRLEIEGSLPLEKMPARIEEPAQLLGMNALGLSSDHIDGVLGYNLLSLFRIQLDLTRSKMV